MKTLAALVRLSRSTPSAAFHSGVLAIALSLAAAPAQAQLISEFQPNPPGADPATQDFELSGTPLAAFSGWILSVESDSGAATGTVDRAASVSGSFDANGLLTFPVADLENPSFTVFLLDNFTGTAGSTDIDTNDDGTADDLSTFGTVFDAIGVPDAVGDEAFLYAAQLGGTDLAYSGREPEIVFRNASTGAIFVVNLIGDSASIFDAAAVNILASDFDTDPSAGTTFGAINPDRVIPVELMSFQVE